MVSVHRGREVLSFMTTKRGIPTISITLYTQKQTGTDDFGAPIYTETATTVSGVNVGLPSSEDIINELNLTGKRIAYTLALPADDTHDWVNKTVEFYGHKFRTIGAPVQFIDGFMGADYPWNKKISVEAFE